MLESKNITEPYPGIFQVRVRRNNQFYSKTFKASHEDSREKAFERAKTWRDQVKRKAGRIDRVGGKTRQNKTTGIHGIYSKITHSSDGKREYFKFVVHYKNTAGEHKNREFSAGNLDSLTQKRLLHVFKVALLFRKTYEFFRKKANENDSHIEEFSDWRSWSENKIHSKFDSIGMSLESVERCGEFFNGQFPASHDSLG